MTKTHGFGGRLSQTEEQKKFYNCFLNIKARCNNKNNKGYPNYGGRGIKCERKTFEEFMDDMRESFQEKCKEIGIDNVSIDRINVDGNYCKENCRRTDLDTQANNKRNNRVVIIDGKERTAKMLSNLLGCSEGKAQNRIKKFEEGKMTKERVFSTDKLFQERKKYYINGEQYDVYRLMEECDINIVTAGNRLMRFKKGIISTDVLFHKGPYPRGTYKKNYL